MKHIKAVTYIWLGTLAGCSGGGSDEGLQPAAESVAEPDAPDTELARLEFDDGNVVRFEALKGGVLVSETGPDLNPRRLVPQAGMTALDAYKALAPGRTIPAALLQMHEQMYAGGERFDSVADPAELSADPDLEHDGDFQQSYPSSTFLPIMCDFSVGDGSYKHADRTDAHTDISLDVHAAYFAAGADIGTITAEPCAGRNEGGSFDGQCGETISLNAGFHNSGFYDAGDDYVCTRGGGIGCQIFGCPEICVRNHVRFELRFGKISNSVRFHECVQVTH